MERNIEVRLLENRLGVIKQKNKKGSTGVIKKLERQLRNLKDK